MTKTNKDAYEDERRTKKKPSGKKPVKRELSKKEKARKKRRRIVFFTLEILVLIVMVIVLWGVLKVGDSGHVEIVEDDIVINPQVKAAAETTKMLGYRNIALFGVDSTGGLLSKGTRSDTIMVASIDQNTGDCKLISVYRDTYLNLSNDNYDKCNAAYSKGGPEMAMSMLNMNLDLDITDFVTVGFVGLTDTIDALGGVYIDVDSNEILHLNNYQSCIAKDLKRTYTMVESTGYQLLDGLQATGYCRIRYTARGDFERTERQREVLSAVADQAKKAPVTSLVNIANNVFDEVYTSLNLTEIVDLLKDVSKYSITDTAGFPRDEHIGDKSFGTKGRCVVPTDLEADVKWLHEFLFNDSDYEPSETVKECSRQIQADYAK